MKEDTESSSLISTNKLDPSNPDLIEKAEKDIITRIINDYKIGKTNLKIIISISFLMLIEGIEFTIYGIFQIPLTSYMKFSDTVNQVASSTFFVFVGLGSICSGFLSDIVEKTTIINALNFLIILFHLLASLIKNRFLFIFFRNFLAMSYGLIIPIAINLLAEYLPVKIRGFLLVSLWIFWGVGELINVALLNLIIPDFDSSRLYICLLILEVFVIVGAIVNFFCLKDSPRNLISKFGHKKNKLDEAFEILKEMNNNVELSEFQKKYTVKELTRFNKENKIEGRFIDLFNKTYLKPTLIINFLAIFLYIPFYGIILIHQKTLFYLEKQRGELSTEEINKKISKQQLIIVLMVLPSSIVSGLLIEIKQLGRKKSGIALSFLGVLFIIFCLVFKKYFFIFMAVYVFILAGNVNYPSVMTSEFYPTCLRDKASGLIYLSIRCGAFISQFLFLALENYNEFIPYYFMLGSQAIGMILYAVFPQETYGKKLDSDS